MAKKFTALVLTILFITPLAVSASDIDLLSSLGAATLTDSDAVSRGEFVYSAAAVFASGFSLEKTKTDFSDVSSSNQYSGAVAIAAQLGWTLGYGDGTFGVNDDITLEQAVIITLRALGYDPLISSFGGYMQAANYIGITDDITVTSDPLTGDTAAKLLRNALEANALVQTGFGQDLSWEADEKLTNFKQQLGIDIIEGIVTDNGISTLTSPSSVRSGCIVIDGMLIDASDFPAADKLGCRVRAYVKTDAKTPVLVYLENNETNIIKIPAASIENTSTLSINYTNPYGIEKIARISNLADYIYNGIAAPDTGFADLKIDEGSLVLIDNDGDSKADVVSIENSTTIVAQNVNHDGSFISAHYGTDVSIPDDAVVNVIKDGNKAEITSIDEWNVLTVYKSKDSSVVTIYISDKIFRGTLTEKSQNKETLVIDGESYNLLNKSLADKLMLGSEYEFCTDMYGNVVYTLDSFEYSVAVLVDAKYQSSGLDGNMKIKVFTHEGTVLTLECADKVDFCGVSKAEKDIEPLLALPQYSLIGYKLNKDGEISAISLTTDNVPAGYTVKDNFCNTYSGSEITYQSQQKSFEGKIMINNATKIFVLPSDKTDESKYFISDISEFVSGNKYNVTAFIAGNDDWYADYIICIPQNEYGKTHGAVLVDCVSTKIDEDGDTVEVLKGYNEKGEVSYIGADGLSFIASGMKRGDIVRCILNPLGEVCDVRMVFKQEEFAFKNDGGETYSKQPRFIHGYVYEKNKNLVKISLYPNIPPAVTDSNMEIHDFSGMKIYEYNAKKDIIEIITADRLNDFVTNNNDYSKLFLYTMAAAPKFAVSYK